MVWQYPAWLTHLALASGVGSDIVFVGPDSLALPLLYARNATAFQVTEALNHVIPVEGGGRYLEEITAGYDLKFDPSPLVLLTDGMTQEQIATVIAVMGASPTAILCTGGSPSIPGYQHASPMLPGLFTSQEAINFAEVLANAAERQCQAGADGFDALDELCDPSPILRRVQFHSAGDAMVGLLPVALVRDLDLVLGQQLVLTGAVHLQCWRPVTLRIPTFGLTDTEIQFSFSSGAGSQTVSIQCKGRGGFSVLRPASKQSSLQTVKLTGAPGMLVDLVLTGHDTTLDAVDLRLPALNRQKQDPDIDPLNRYADPLAHYG